MEASALRGKIGTTKKAAELTGMRVDKIVNMVKNDRGLAVAFIGAEDGILFFYLPAVKRWADVHAHDGESYCPTWMYLFRAMTDGEIHTVSGFEKKFGFNKNSMYTELTQLTKWGVIEKLSNKIPKKYRITEHGRRVWRIYGDTAKREDMVREVKKITN